MPVRPKKRRWMLEWQALAGMGLLACALSGATPAHAQSEWFRPPGSVSQPNVRPDSQNYRPPIRQEQRRERQQIRRETQTRQVAPPPQRQQSWSPLQPFIELFRPQQRPRYVAPSRPRPSAPAVRAAPPVIEQAAEPRGKVYDSAADAKKASEVFAQIVLVIGDEYASSLAQGLADTFVVDREKVAVVGKSEAASGLGPASSFDWNIAARQIAAAEQADLIVVFAGMNDLRPIEDPAGRAEVLDDRWRDIYGRRVDEFLLNLKLYGRPVVVVGLPPVEDGAANARTVQLNALLKDHVERAGLVYADVTDGFVDEDGKFMMSGPDVDGQRRRLRAPDGIGFTRAGGRKLAFFVDRQLDGLLADPDDPATAMVNPADARPSIILLTGGGASGARVLAGAPGTTTPAAQPAVAQPDAAPEPARVLVSGSSLPAVLGRTDDFSWPAGQAAGALRSPAAQTVAPAAAPSATAGAATATPAAVQPSPGTSSTDAPVPAAATPAAPSPGSSSPSAAPEADEPAPPAVTP